MLPDLQYVTRSKEHFEGTISNTVVDAPVKLYPPHFIIDSKIGKHTYISKNAIITLTEIGKFCSIGPNLLCGWGIHPINGISTSPMFYSTQKQNGHTLTKENKVEERKKVIIGNDVFIGMNVTILDGVVIGDGAVIGASTLVSKNVPPYAVVVGNPMRIIKYRFSEPIIKELIELKWWEMDEEGLKLVEENFFEIDDFLAKAKSYSTSIKEINSIKD